jgi:alpha-L-rhamnosidase
MRFGYDMSTTARTVINAWAYLDYNVMAKIAEQLGNTVDRDMYNTRANALEAAINAQLINASGTYIDGLISAGLPSTHVSQHANMFPLALGIVPTAQRPSVVSKVNELNMSVGMVTVQWLVRALGEADQGPALINLYTNAANLGWARCLQRGATATWESWTSDTNAESQSHPWGAAGLHGYVRYILGIQPLLPQYEQVRIKPLSFGAALPSASGSVATDRGAITVSWTRHNAGFSMSLVIPTNVTALVYVPSAGGTGPVVTVDGASLTGTEEGNYVFVGPIGSGAHTFERLGTPALESAWQPVVSTRLPNHAAGFFTRRARRPDRLPERLI